MLKPQPQSSRIDPKRRQHIDHKKKQFAKAQYAPLSYPQRLNFYLVPPTTEVTLEEFEEWAIHRLKVLSELEACQFRNRSPEETADYMRPILEQYMPLSQNTSRSPSQQQERKKDHYSHYILRLAFAATEDLRRRFARLETQLFRLRFLDNDSRDRQDFIESLSFEWEKVTDAEKSSIRNELNAVSPPSRNKNLSTTPLAEEDAWFKVPFEAVPDLLERRSVFLRAGQAYVPARELPSMMYTAFTTHLDKQLELTQRALPRLDEDDRLAPILAHLSQNFSAPGTTYTEDSALGDGANISAASVDPLSQHFPLCMRNLHITLRKNAHLKHYGRLQYTLFLKGIGLSLEDCLLFWRQSFNRITDDQFNKEYRYNVRHAYGDVGGDSNRRGKGYTPYSCQKLLTEAAPAPGQQNGCPYKTYNQENLMGLLQATGVRDGAVLKGVKEDVEKQRYHIACNRVFEWAHAKELKKVKDEGIWSAADLDTIVHPNVWFKRSYLLKHLGVLGSGAAADGVAKREVVMQD